MSSVIIYLSILHLKQILRNVNSQKIIVEKDKISNAIYCRIEILLVFVDIQVFKIFFVYCLPYLHSFFSCPQVIMAALTLCTSKRQSRRRAMTYAQKDRPLPLGSQILMQIPSYMYGEQQVIYLCWVQMTYIE